MRSRPLTRSPPLLRAGGWARRPMAQTVEPGPSGPGPLCPASRRGPARGPRVLGAAVGRACVWPRASRGSPHVCRQSRRDELVAPKSIRGAPGRGGGGHPASRVAESRLGPSAEPRLCAHRPAPTPCPFRTPGYLWKQTLEATRRGLVTQREGFRGQESNSFPEKTKPSGRGPGGLP